MPRIRVHQHVNPLSPYYQQPPSPIDLARCFADPSLPLHLDIGCARGRFILRMAETQPQWNFLGVEIREPLVTEANEIANEKNLNNLHYEFCNAMSWLDRLLDDVPQKLLQMATIQFPDPWFKNRHAKRRMVNTQMAESVVKSLAKSGHIFIQTDIEFLSEEMRTTFRTIDGLQEIAVSENPFSIKTEREAAVENKNLPVYRTMFAKSEPPA